MKEFRRPCNGITGGQGVSFHNIGPASRRRRWLIAGSATAVVLAAALGIRHSIEAGGLAGLGTAVATMLAAGVAALAISLPGKSPEGTLVGLGLPFAGIMAWTFVDKPIYTWAVQGALGLILAIWTFRWWQEWRVLPRLGAFWLAVPIWFLGALTAAVSVHNSVMVQRLVYGGFALLVTLILVQGRWRRGRDVSVGLVAGFLLCLSLILLAGADYVFTTERFAPASGWGQGMADRFWGGPLLIFHPNPIAMTAVIAAMRIAPDKAFRTWHRLASLGAAAIFLILAESRTALLAAGVAAVGWFGIVLLRNSVVRRKPLLLLTKPRFRVLLAQALLPIFLVGTVFAVSGGADIWLAARYPETPQKAVPSASANPSPSQGPSALPRVDLNSAASGRVDVWKLIVADWRGDTPAEKVAGNADNARGVILRHKWDFAKGPAPSWYYTQPKLGADNALFAALRRGGILGVAVAVLGLALVLWRATRRQAPIWFTVCTIGLLASVLTEDDLLYTTPAWAILLAGEILVYSQIRRGDRSYATPPTADR